MKISVVASYFNRRQLLINTLNTISKTLHNDYEVIVIDDASDDNHRIEDLVDTYSFLKVIRVEKEDKWYINPCVPYNMGFKEVTGDVVIIQNPECLHVGDIIHHANSNIREGLYLSYSCYSANQDTTERFSQFDLSEENIHKEINFNNRMPSFDGDSAWYNHPTYRPVGYHFCSAIMKKDLDRIGGFDEKYAYGIGYDDDDFVRKVRGNLQFNFVTNPFVIHQHHYHIEHSSRIIENAHDKLQNNRKLYYGL